MTEQSHQTRRSLFRRGLTLLAGAVVVSTATRRARAQEKIEQAQVQYQNEPKDGAQCNACVNWVAPNACTIVAGEINPKGWCVAYAPKES